MNVLRQKLASLISLLALSLFATAVQAIPVVAYESLPLYNSNHVSVHRSGGPVLADDFTPALSGSVVQVDWWGTAPLRQQDQWEITFHPDGGGIPAPIILSQHIVGSGGTDPDMDGVYFYSAAWNPQDMVVTAGLDYWFSVANASGYGWAWAHGASATVGSEQYRAQESQGAAGSPHFGPWSSICGCDDDFAFRVYVDRDVPEPASIALMGIGLLGIYTARRRRRIIKT